jgi:hypothetical protein
VPGATWFSIPSDRLRSLSTGNTQPSIMPVEDRCTPTRPSARRDLWWGLMDFHAAWSLYEYGTPISRHGAPRTVSCRDTGLVLACWVDKPTACKGRGVSDRCELLLPRSDAETKLARYHGMRRAFLNLVHCDALERHVRTYGA